MSKGRAKGYKKDIITIKDNSLEPYYIIREERQFVVMEENNTIPCGYFVKLQYALDFISKQVQIKKNRGKTMNIDQFMRSYNDVADKIMEAVLLWVF